MHTVKARRWWSRSDRQKARLLQEYINTPEFQDEVGKKITNAWKKEILYGSMLAPLQDKFKAK